MAVPKRKTGRARSHARRSANMKLTAPSRSTCPQCGAVKLPHRVCGNCGHYRDREVIETA
jgi:large subunit ribosomal protein L32